LAVKPKKILSALKKAIQLLLILVCGYFLVLALATLWTFEVKLYRWPIFVYAAPFSIRVGDDINRIRLFERLARQGYSESPVPVPEPGEWSRSGSGITIFLRHCPIKGGEIASGPVTLTLDWERVRSMRFMRSLEEVNSISLEPELIQVIPPSGFGQELCRPVSLRQIPPLLVDAVVLTEDPRFFTHSGVDLVSIGRAFIANIKAWRYAQGGSTIPQQLIRMVMLSPEKTMGRKINEVFLALTASALYSKKTILEAYLNRIYYGQWGPFPIKGVSEAARHFFGKGLGELDAAECALMAAIIRAPSVITPRRHPERALARRNMVLGLLFKAGKISRECYDEAINRPVIMKKPGQIQVRAAAFAELVRAGLPAQVPGTGPKNLRQDVLTSLDPLMQSDSERRLRRLGEAGARAHLLLVDPQSGDIKAFIAPSPETGWSGVGGNIATVLPLIIAPALVPEDPAHPKFTLTSTFFVPTQPSGMMTFREAYRKDREFLIRNLVSSLGAERIVSVLREFGAPARQAAGGGVTLDPVNPIDLAQSYALMATLGNAGVINPGIRVTNWGNPSVEGPPKRHVSVKPAAIYMANHLMKGLESVAINESLADKIASRPSLFSARDEQGIWGVAYRSDMLLVIRLPGIPLSNARIRKLMLRLLPPPGQGFMASVPEGLVFRNICVESGLLATSICPRVVKEPFFKGTQPVEWCPYRHDTAASARPATGY
jgi:penicillin-binding protein 1B